MKRFLRQWGWTEEAGVDQSRDFTPEEAARIEAESPMSFEFRAEAQVNGKMFPLRRSSAVGYLPFPYDGDDMGRRVAEHYGLDLSQGWHIFRCAFPWPRRRQVGSLSLTLKGRKKHLPGQPFSVKAGERVELPDPAGAVLNRVERPSGIVVEKTAVPMGVIAIIYESRPNVTSDAAALALKAGSACVLRGGKEAHRSAAAIVAALKEGLSAAGLPEDALQLVEDTTRASSNELMTATGYVDLLIPRGGAGLIRACVDNATVPVIETGTGICHIYVDRAADQEMALNIVENAKCSRPSVCNAAEVCLVDRAVAEEFLPKLRERLVDRRADQGAIPVELRLDQAAAQIISGTHAGPEDFDTEFLELCAGRQGGGRSGRGCRPYRRPLHRPLRRHCHRR